MTRRIALALIAALCLSTFSSSALAKPKEFTPGAAGLGDPYFPLDGNGGYDVGHYFLNVGYDPATDFLTGVATITAKATQNLSSFNLDLEGLELSSVTVDGVSATWTRDGGELTVIPAEGIRNNNRFVVVIAYSGVPETLQDGSGFIHTADGALIIGQPHVAATWFPANDHPIDTAAYTLSFTVPDGLEAVANGDLVSQTSAGGLTTWVWDARDPMTTYLVGAGIGEFALNSYRVDKIQYVDAIDTALLARVAARTGTQFAISGQADFSYNRLTRTIVVPEEGATLSFWVTRETEPFWDFFMVEAHTLGDDSDWTTLPDVTGHASDETGGPCSFWQAFHPFLEHYQTPTEEGCEPSGTTGEWWAASGASGGWEEWVVDLGAWAGSTIEVSLTYVSDDIVQHNGVFVDDITVSAGEGTTSFEADGDVMDGWTVPGPPEGSPVDGVDWFVGTSADAPPSIGERAQASLARQDEIISFLESFFGPYPFHAAGGIVDDPDIFFALENQTRPIYWKGFFWDPASGDSVVVHELAHQWAGDSVRIAAWQHIWLNEGLATYMEWLWAEQEGLGTVQETFDFWLEVFPEGDPFWDVIIGDPGPDLLFDFAVYIRGAMTLHQLRLTVGDDAFFRILEQWVRSNAGEAVTTDEFIALAEKISGMELDALFNEWLFTAGRPQVAASDVSRLGAQAARTLLLRLQDGQPIGRK